LGANCEASLQEFGCVQDIIKWKQTGRYFQSTTAVASEFLIAEKENYYLYVTKSISERQTDPEFSRSDNVSLRLIAVIWYDRLCKEANIV